MKMKRLSRTASVLVTGILASTGGFSGLAFASTNVSNTGPDATVSVSESDTKNCTMLNNNTVQAQNNTNQSGTTGAVTVSGNTSAGSSWGAWDPAVWSANGYTYAQWQSVFNGYMQTVQSGWGAAGSSAATSGNVTNTNNTLTSVAIQNGSTNSVCGLNTLGGNGLNTVTNYAPNANVTAVLSATTNANRTNNNSVGAAGQTNQYGATGNVSGANNTNLGATRSGAVGNGNATGAHVGLGNNSQPAQNTGTGTTVTFTNPVTVSNSGPDANVSYSATTNTNTSIVNTNNITTIANTSQNSTTGNATVANNTSAGGAQSGNGENTNATASTVHVQN